MDRNRLMVFLSAFMAIVMVIGGGVQALCSESSGCQQPNADGSTVQQYGAVQSDVDGTYDVSQAGGREMVSYSPSPINEEQIELRWTYKAGDRWQDVPGTGVIVGDYYYVKAGATIHKISIATGEDVASAPSVDKNFMYGHWVDYLDYGDGYIVDNPGATVYDLDLNPLFKFDVGLGSQSYSSKTVENGGYMYVVNGRDFTVTKYDLDTTGLTAEDVKQPIWSVKTYEGTDYKSATRVYYPVVVGDYIYHTHPSGIVTAISCETGEIVDTYDATHYEKGQEGPFDGMAVNNEMTYYDGHLYLSLYGGGIFATGTGDAVVEIPIDVTTGQMDEAEIRYILMEGGNNNSSFLVYNGYGFSNAGNTFYLIDMESFTVVATAEGDKVSRGNMSLNTYYDAEGRGNKVYAYVVPYTAAEEGKVYISIFECTLGDTPSVVKHACTVEGVAQYGTEFVQFGPNGELIFHNDSKTIHCYGNTDLVKITFSGADVASVNAVAGTVADKPADPVKEGYSFAGWYVDEECTEIFDWTKPITSDATLYANWTAEDTSQSDSLEDMPQHDNTILYVSAGIVAVALIGLCIIIYIRKG